MADEVTTRLVFICPKCQCDIGDGGMCSYECEDDALPDEERDSIIAREYEVTCKTIRERVVHNRQQPFEEQPNAKD